MNISQKRYQSKFGIVSFIILALIILLALVYKQNVKAEVVPNSCFSFASGTIYYYNITDPLCVLDVTIPNEIDGAQVTAIGPGAFNGMGLTSVSIPNTVTTIGISAFSGNSLSAVEIPDSVTTVDISAFSDNLISSLVIPDSVITIASSAFSSNAIADIDISNSVTTIGDGAFASNLLTELTIPDSVTSLGGSAFASNNISTLTIGNNVQSLTPGQFSGNPLNSVTIGSADFTGTPTIVIEDSAFNNDPNPGYMETLTLGNSIVSIGDYAFQNNQISSLELGASITSIGEGAFAGNQLVSVSIPDSVSTLGIYAFVDNNLESITTWGSVIIDGDVLSGNIINTGSYIQLYTGDPSNPYNYTDLAGIYIVNPAQLSIRYVDSSDVELAPSVYSVGDTLTDYTVSANPDADFSLYYRSQATRFIPAILIDDYITPEDQTITLAAGQNDVGFVYLSPFTPDPEPDPELDPGPNMPDMPGAPNTGIYSCQPHPPYATITL